MQVALRLRHLDTQLDKDSWEPGHAYVLHIDFANGDENAASAAVHAWAHASIGQMSANYDPSSENATLPDGPCTNAYHSDSTSTSHQFIWTAPEAGTDECAIISAAVATGSSSAYQTNTVRSVRNGFCGCTHN